MARSIAYAPVGHAAARRHRERLEHKAIEAAIDPYLSRCLDLTLEHLEAAQIFDIAERAIDLVNAGQNETAQDIMAKKVRLYSDKLHRTIDLRNVVDMRVEEVEDVVFLVDAPAEATFPSTHRLAPEATFVAITSSLDQPLTQMERFRRFSEEYDDPLLAMHDYAQLQYEYFINDTVDLVDTPHEWSSPAINS